MDAGISHTISHATNMDPYATRPYGLSAEVQVEADPLYKGERQCGQMSTNCGLGEGRRAR